MRLFLKVFVTTAMLTVLLSCSSGEYSSRKQSACIIHRDMTGTTYERVTIVGEADEAHWEVVFPDSTSREIQIVSKSTVSTAGCPFSFFGPGLFVDWFHPAESR